MANKILDGIKADLIQGLGKAKGFKIDPRKHILMNLPYVLGGLVANQVALAYRTSTSVGAMDRAMDAINGLNTLFEMPYISLNGMDFLYGLCGGVGFYLIIYFRKKNAKKYRHGVEYGSARFGTEKDIAPFIDPAFENNILLTQTERVMLGRNKIPKYNINKNVIVIGGSGSGKTRFHVRYPLLTQRRQIPLGNRLTKS